MTNHKGHKDYKVYKPRALNQNSHIQKLLLERKWTDEEIIAIINKVYPYHKTPCSTKRLIDARYQMNHGLVKSIKLDKPIRKIISINGTKVSVVQQHKPITPLMPLDKSTYYIVNGRKGQYELTTTDQRECFHMNDTNQYEYFKEPTIEKGERI